MRGANWLENQPAEIGERIGATIGEPLARLVWKFVSWRWPAPPVSPLSPWTFSGAFLGQKVGGFQVYLGLGQTFIPENESVEITLRPEGPFIPLRLFVPSTVTGLVLTSCRVGDLEPLFTRPTGVPIELFSEVANTDPGIEWPALSPTRPMILTVRRA